MSAISQIRKTNKKNINSLKWLHKEKDTHCRNKRLVLTGLQVFNFN